MFAVYWSNEGEAGQAREVTLEKLCETTLEASAFIQTEAAYPAHYYRVRKVADEAEARIFEQRLPSKNAGMLDRQEAAQASADFERSQEMYR
jgi:hypothetical protein